jgi:hypothetical protein
VNSAKSRRCVSDKSCHAFGSPETCGSPVTSPDKCPAGPSSAPTKGGGTKAPTKFKSLAPTKKGTTKAPTKAETKAPTKKPATKAPTKKGHTLAPTKKGHTHAPTTMAPTTNSTTAPTPAPHKSHATTIGDLQSMKRNFTSISQLLASCLVALRWPGAATTSSAR